MSVEQSSEASILEPSAEADTNQTDQQSKQLTTSISDSAYESLVCSPFTPQINLRSGGTNTTTEINTRLQTTVTTNSSATSSPWYQLHSPALSSTSNANARASCSSCTSWNRAGDEDEDIFKMSIEKIDNQSSNNSNNNNNNNNNMAERIPANDFIPISRSEMDYNDNYPITQFNFSNVDIVTDSTAPLRSISTQTSIFYTNRPNSAPLYEDIEEELEEIERGINITGRSGQMVRNSTYNCMQSPMPDLIPSSSPYRDNRIIANRLSLIADDIDKRHSSDLSHVSSLLNQQSEGSNRYNRLQQQHQRQYRRQRRLSTSAIYEMSPEGTSLIDLIYSVYNVFWRPRRSASATQRPHSNSENSTFDKDYKTEY